MSDLETVRQRSLYGPRPPPIIIRRSEAGDPNSPTSYVPITWERRPGEIELSSGASFDLRDQLLTLKIPFLLDDLADIKAGNSNGFRMWLLGYALNEHLTDQSGWMYLAKIAKDEALYPEKIQEVMDKYIQPQRRINEFTGNPPFSQIRPLNLNSLDEYPRLITLANELDLFLPKELTQSQLKYMFLTGLYWLRYLRPEKPRLIQLDQLNLIDLYLITSNPFERYPARKFLSYFPDQYLYANFGRLGNYYFPKTYLTKKQQLDGLVQLSRFRFGYFEVNSWTHPIQLTFISSESPFGPETRTQFNLDSLLNKLDEGPTGLIFRFPTEISSWSKLPLLQLGIMVQSTWPILTNQSDWLPLITILNKYSDSLYEEYLDVHQSPFQLEVDRNPQMKTIIHLPNELKSIEQEFNTCILCLKIKSSEDFGLCGHGVCSTCQAWLKTVKCPFCQEHFVSENISDEFVETLTNQINTGQNLRDRVNRVKHLKNERDFKFDWANSNFRLFGVFNL